MPSCARAASESTHDHQLTIAMARSITGATDLRTRLYWSMRGSSTAQTPRTLWSMRLRSWNVHTQHRCSAVSLSLIHCHASFVCLRLRLLYQSDAPPATVRYNTVPGADLCSRAQSLLQQAEAQMSPQAKSGPCFTANSCALTAARMLLLRDIYGSHGSVEVEDSGRPRQHRRGPQC